MGNSESTSRIIAMQRGEDGVIQISENVMNHLQGKKSNYILLNEGEQIMHEDQLYQLLEKTLEEGKRIEGEKLKEEVVKIKEETDSLLAQWDGDKKKLIAETELKWKLLVEETAEKEREALRTQLEEDEKRKMKELEAHWKLILEQTKKEEQEALYAQLKAEEGQKIAELESHYKKLYDEVKQKASAEVNDVTSQQQAVLEEIAEKEKEALQAQLLLEQLRNEKEAVYLRLQEETNEKLKDLEDRWQVILEEETGKVKDQARKEAEEEQLAQFAEIEARCLATFNEKLENEEKLNVEYLEKEKLIIDAMERRWMSKLEEETKQKLKEAEEEWQSVLQEQIRKVSDAVRGEVESEQCEKFAEMEAGCLATYNQTLEAEKESIHAQYLEREKRLIEEIEARWIQRLEKTEEEHVEKMNKIDESHQAETNLTNSKLQERGEIVNNMQTKLLELQLRQDDVQQEVDSRHDDIQQQFTTSAEKVDSQIKHLKMKAVCVDTRNSTMNCYKTYPNHPLRCSDEVKKFVDCVQQERVSLLQRNVAN